MNELKIKYVGGFRQVSKYLTREHDANFAVIIDSLVNIHNMNTTKLVKISEKLSVKISNDFLSRHTGLGISIIKSNIKKIEDLGLITVIKKGQSNTRHYIIHIKRINEYTERLEGKFQQWFEDSLENSKKDKTRLDHHDLEKQKTSQKKYEEIIEGIKNSTRKSTNQLVQNQPTQKGKTNQPKRSKQTVVETSLETTEETTTEDNSVVVQVFNNKDEKGIYYLYEVEGFEKRVYLKEYKEYMENLNELSDKKREELDQQVLGYDVGPDEEIVFYEGLSPSELKKQIKEEKENKSTWLRKTPLHKIMKTIDRNVESVKRKRKKEERRIYETTKEPASSEVSIANWGKLKKAYDELPNIENQGKFYVSKEDLKNFKTLSMYRQENVISIVTAMKKSDKTASRPATYIEEAMLDKLPTIKNTKEIINVMI